MPVEFIGMIGTRDQSEIRAAQGPVIAESIESASKRGRWGSEAGRQRSALGLPLHAAKPCATY